MARLWSTIQFRHLLPRAQALCLMLACAATADQPAAFPGAVGQGATASGGRGGDVYHVTTLKDYDPRKEQKIEGSLRHAIRSAEAPRTVVFDVAGAVALRAPLKIFKSNLTIAGQSAPAPGITLWGYPVEVGKGANVIVRYLRIRLGDFHARVGGSDKPHSYQGNNDLDPSSANAVSIGGGCQRVIVDHLSASWGMDETLSVTVCKDVTVQNSIIAHSLNDSFHPKGPHGYGSLVRGELTPAERAEGTGGFTFYQNLWAHHRARNPSIGGEQQVSTTPRGTDVNLINNVIYNWRDQPTHRSELGPVRINMIGNYYICGPAKSNDRIFKEGTSDVTRVYHDKNVVDADQDSDHDGQPVDDEKQIARSFRDFGTDDELQSTAPFSFIRSVAKQVRTADEAYDQVIASVGCSLARDPVDEATIQSVSARTGKLINSQEQLRNTAGKLSGVDDLPETHRPVGFDTDGDGMPNEFEVSHDLDPDDPADGNGTDLSGAGYTNLEVYLNGLID